MAKRVGVVQISIEAGTARFIADMDVAKAKIGQFGTAAKTAGGSTRSSMIEASASLRGLQGNFDQNIRAVERFTSVTLGMGGLFKVMFPIVGGIAFGTMLFELGEKVNEFFKSISAAPSKIAVAFRELNAPLRITNDELQVTNDRLANDIAKLEGKRQNTLKLALDEAVVAADRLADSLDKDLANLNKLLDEQNVSIWRKLLGEAGTTDVKKEFGGETGFQGFRGGIATITDEGNDKIRAATTAKEKDAAQTELNTRLLRAYAGELDEVNVQLAKSQRLQYERSHPVAKIPLGVGMMGPSEMPTSIADQAARIALLQGVRRQLNFERDSISQRATNTNLTGKKEALEASRANEELDRPFQERMKAMQATLDGVRAKITAIGQSETYKTVAEGFAESIRIIAEVNKALDKHKTKLTDAEMGQISLAAQQTATDKSTLAWGEKLDETTKRIKDEVLAQEMLTAAIGKGYEAVKRANIETTLMSSLGPKYSDPKYKADVDNLRAQESLAYDAKATTQGTQAVDALKDQIELEGILAKVQIQGAEAVRYKTLQFHLEKLEHDKIVGVTKEQIQLEYDFYKAKRANEAAADVAKLNVQIAAVEQLTAAQLKGAEAVRKAGLENKYAEMKLEGKSPAVIEQTRRDDDARHQEQISGEARKLVTTYQDQLDVLEKQRDVIVGDILKAGAESIDQARVLRDIENERLAISVKQALAGGTAKDGVRAFFLEMQQEAKTAAVIIYEALNSALDKVSDQFTKLITGQKTDFAKMFQEVGQDMLKSSIKSGLQNALGALGKKLGIEAKPDGSTPAKALWVRMADGQKDWGSSKMGDPQDQNNGPLGLGRIPISQGFFAKAFSFLGHLVSGSGGGGGGGESVSSSVSYPGMAAGGFVSANQAYMVGENGPEILTGASGRISSNADSRSMLGGGPLYQIGHIDARGGDPEVTAQAVHRAITEAHNSAVSKSVQVSSDRLRRTPAHA